VLNETEKGIQARMRIGEKRGETERKLGIKDFKIEKAVTGESVVQMTLYLTTKQKMKRFRALFL
jgi:hypothetical protein